MVDAPAEPAAPLPTRLRRWARSIFLTPLLRVLRLVFGALGWRQAQSAGHLLGRLAWHVAARDRRRALDHLALAFPEMPASERETLAHRCVCHLSTSVAELLHLWGRRPDYSTRHVSVEGFAVIEALRREGKPIFLLTGHCGNWELISVANLSHGLGLTAMAREVVGAAQVAEDLRAHLGSVSLPRGDRRAVSGMLRVLRSGGALCMLLDQDFETAGVWVPFFGRLAFTPTAGASLALRLGASVVPTFSERLEDGSHLVCFHPPLVLPGDVTEATALMTKAIEQQIRRRPEQWVWMHRRWRRRPPAEQDRGPNARSKV